MCIYKVSIKMTEFEVKNKIDSLYFAIIMYKHLEYILGSCIHKINTFKSVPGIKVNKESDRIHKPDLIFSYQPYVCLCFMAYQPL